MNASRLTCVIPGYWPAPSTAGALVAELVQGIRRVGLDDRARSQDNARRWAACVITSRLSPALSHDFSLDGCPVQRVGNSGQFPWRRGNFFRAAARAIQSGYVPGDVAMIFEADEHLGEFRKVLGESVPLILRYDSPSLVRGVTGVLAQRRKIRSLQLANRVAVANQSQAAELADAGLDREKIWLLPDWVSPLEQILSTADPALGGMRDARRSQAREALAGIHPLLELRNQDRLVICSVPFTRRPALSLLLAAWRIVQRACPNGRLWLIGESPAAREWMEEVQRLEMLDNVLFPGAFDSTVDLLQAADLVVHPAVPDQDSIFWLQAMRQSSPVVTLPPISAEHSWLQDDVNCFLVDPPSPVALANRMLSVLKDRERSTTIANRASADVGTHCSMAGFFAGLEAVLDGLPADSSSCPSRENAG